MQNRTSLFLVTLFIIPCASLFGMEGQTKNTEKKIKIENMPFAHIISSKTISSNNIPSTQINYKTKLDIPEKEFSTVVYLSSFISSPQSEEPCDLIGFLERMEPNQIITNNLQNQSKTCLYIDYLIKQNDCTKIQKFINLARVKVQSEYRLALDESARRSLRKALDKDVKKKEEQLSNNMQNKIKTLLTAYKEEYQQYNTLLENRKKTFGDHSDDEQTLKPYPKPETLEKGFESLNLFNTSVSQKDQITQPDTQQQQK